MSVNRFVIFASLGRFYQRFVRGIVILGFVGWMLASESAESKSLPRLSDDALLETIERAAFNYFWLEANPTNGLIRDRSNPTSKCSIAAVGFGLTSLPIAVERCWLDRNSAIERVTRILETFSSGPQNPNPATTMGYRGWYYHFLEMDDGMRAWKCELSSIDTALFLAGALSCSSYFDRSTIAERNIRDRVSQIYRRIDWNWMLNGGQALSMGWHPESGFIEKRWTGYNEGMILYILALGAPEIPLPPSSWDVWTASYSWNTHYGQNYIEFAPLFGHQYSHAWIDFRHRADAVMRTHGITYFENSRRATLAQHAYCRANPLGYVGYGPLSWGITACDGPGYGGLRGYAARGSPPPEFDDGTLAPTAVGASLPFAPEICLPTLRNWYENFYRELWTPYGFRDAFNPTIGWWDPEVLGIDQGAMLLMIENYRTGRVWRWMDRVPEIQRGLQRAGFQRVKKT